MSGTKKLVRGGVSIFYRGGILLQESPNILKLNQ